MISILYLQTDKRNQVFYFRSSCFKSQYKIDKSLENCTTEILIISLILSLLMREVYKKSTYLKLKIILLLYIINNV